MKKSIFCFFLIVAAYSCHKDVTVSPVSTDHSSNTLPLGQSAHDFLSTVTYSSINIEIQYAPGMRPQDQSVNNLISFLTTYLNKPGGITVTFNQVGSIGLSSISVQDAYNFEQKNRTVYNSGSTMGVYIYFADADYTQTSVVGVAYKNTSMAVLEKSIQANSGGVNQPGRVKVETGVLEHEFGHLLGLVNNGTSMVVAHEDAAHKDHCNNSSCLMYFQIESYGLMGVFDNTVPTLDANCRNDLKANGGK